LFLQKFYKISLCFILRVTTSKTEIKEVLVAKEVFQLLQNFLDPMVACNRFCKIKCEITR